MFKYLVIYKYIYEMLPINVDFPSKTTFLTIDNL